MTDTTTGVFTGYSTVLDNWIQLGLASGRAISCSFHATQPDANEILPPSFQDLLDTLDAGTPIEVTDYPIALTVPTPKRQIYETVRTIPAGESRSLDSLSRSIPFESDSSIDTVRAALGTNPIPLLIPDHRVTEPVGTTPPTVRERLREIERL